MITSPLQTQSTLNLEATKVIKLATILVSLDTRKQGTHCINL